uniref:Peptidase S1 domain-containing protein n=1 Tax=Megaselia scalaris TaxID=36166 RepID=T1H1K8_MEGSC
MAPEDRISNGKTAELGQFPYHAKLDLQDSNGKFFRCGGSLIASEWIVTAGHCIKGLSTPVHMNENVATIDLPADDGDDYVGDVFTVSGFGRLGRNKPLSNTLQYTELKIRPNSICQRLYNHEDFNDTKLCCKGRDGESTCSGDSGGPLADLGYSGNRNRLIGLVSVGKGSCEGKNPSGFTKVAPYVDWINEQMGMQTYGQVN